MSPEKIRGAKVDQRSDIYSLGVTVYSMVDEYYVEYRPSRGRDGVDFDGAMRFK